MVSTSNLGTWNGQYINHRNSIAGWWFQPTPLKNMMEFASWDDDIPNWREKNVPNHQPNRYIMIYLPQTIAIETMAHLDPCSSFFYLLKMENSCSKAPSSSKSFPKHLPHPGGSDDIRRASYKTLRKIWVLKRATSSPLAALTTCHAVNHCGCECVPGVPIKQPLNGNNDDKPCPFSDKAWLGLDKCW